MHETESKPEKGTIPIFLTHALGAQIDSIMEGRGDEMSAADALTSTGFGEPEMGLCHRMTRDHLSDFTFGETTQVGG